MADTATKPLDTAAQPPREFQKHTRACFRCKLVKTYEQVRVRPNRPEAPPISRELIPPHGRRSLPGPPCSDPWAPPR